MFSVGEIFDIPTCDTFDDMFWPPSMFSAFPLLLMQGVY